MTDFLLMQRRDALKSLLAISAAGSLTACVGEGKSGEGSQPKLSSAPSLSASEMALVSALGQTIIPMTETAGANEAGVFTNPAGKDNGIQLTQDSAIRADVFFDAIAVHVNGQLGSRLAPVGEFSDFAHVIDTADALQAALAV